MIRVGSHGKLSGAIVRVRRELVEPRDAVGRHANDSDAGAVELFFLLRKGVGFNIAALGIRRRVEINDYRTFF